MITNNLSAYKKYMLSSTSSGDRYMDCGMPLVDIDGITGDIWVSGDYRLGVVNNTSYGNVNNQGTFLSFGSNNAEAKETDNKLSAYAVTTDYTIISQTCTRSVDNGNVYLNFTSSFKAVKSMVINEVGLMHNTYLNGITRQLLFAREVLPQPKTVSAGETFTVSMVIEM